MKRTTRCLAVAAVLALGPAISSADMIDFDFSSFGTVSVQNGNLDTEGVAVAFDVDHSLPGFSFWDFSGVQTLYGLGPIALAWGDDSTQGLGWRMSDGAGDSLWGSFFSLIAGSGGTAVGQITYTVEGGTGVFNGANGQGKSSAAYADGNYAERGDLKVNVPEPGMFALLAAAALALLAIFRRRRDKAPLGALSF